MTSPRDHAFVLEPLVDAAWPAEERMAVGPWTLRAAGGVTHRANSVLTVGRVPAPGEAAPLVIGVDAMLADAERFYAERRLPPIFRISPATVPGYLDSMLERKGYAIERPTRAMIASADDVLDATEGARADGQPFLSARAPDGAWFDGAFADDAAARRAVHEAIVRRIERPRLFASIRADGVAVACGFAVSDGGWTGIYSMATRPAQRRRGLATAVLHLLASWALQHGDRSMYLLVQSDNAAAIALYRRVGFTAAYEHHYRVRRG